MKLFRDLNDPEISALLKRGAIGVIPTDTLYGVVASATNRQAVERLYRIKHRDPAKACIVLVGSRKQIANTDSWTAQHMQITDQYWPGPVSIIVPDATTPEYLHRGTHKARYRLPDYPDLQQLLQKSGPLVAPSANREGDEPATTIQQAVTYFGDQVDFYVDGGTLSGKPSTLIEVINGNVVVVRPGSKAITPN